jgi:hypothetical protein
MSFIGTDEARYCNESLRCRKPLIRRQFAPLFAGPNRMPTNPEDGGLRNSLYKKETRSKRRMSPIRRFVWRIVAAIGVGLVRMFWATCRVAKVIGDEHTAKALATAPSLIPVYWHQHQLFCAKYLLLPMAYAASRATLFQWDKFVLPWPFSRIVIAIGAPRQVPRALQPGALEALQKEMAVELKNLFGQARDALRDGASS